MKYTVGKNGNFKFNEEHIKYTEEEAKVIEDWIDSLRYAIEQSISDAEQYSFKTSFYEECERRFNPEYKKECPHTWIDVGFAQTKLVCKHCNKDKE